MGCGTDVCKLWMIHPNIPPPNLSAQAAATGQDLSPHPPRAEYLTTLSKHTAAVNVVRFSPNGQVLASAGDGQFHILSRLPCRRYVVHVKLIWRKMGMSYFGYRPIGQW